MTGVKPRVLIHHVIPAPLKGINPRTIMGDSMWKKRRALWIELQPVCLACGSSEKLECHESYKYDFKNRIAEFETYNTVCKDCHLFIHLYRCQLLVENEKMTSSEYSRIQDRGMDILKKSGLIGVLESVYNIDIQNRDAAFSGFGDWVMRWNNWEYFGGCVDIYHYENLYTGKKDIRPFKINCRPCS